MARRRPRLNIAPVSRAFHLAALSSVVDKMSREIERKFLLKKAPKLKGADGVRIDQGYLGTNGGELRIRRSGSKHYITVKTEGGTVRGEWEERIPKWVFRLLWSYTKGRRMRKTRYLIRIGRHTAEIDVYRGALKGLVTLECEFDSKKEAKRFELPKKFRGIDVSEDPRYRNRNLASASAPPK